MKGTYKVVGLSVLLWLCLFPCLSVAATITTGPWLQGGTGTSIVIMWETDQRETGEVDYGTSPSYGQTVTSQPKVVSKTSVTGDSPAILYEVRLSNLSPGQRYYYRVRTGNAESAGYQFNTPSKQGSWTFLHTSNPNAYRPSKAKITRDSMLKHNSDFVIISGDVSNNATNQDYRRFFQQGRDLTANTLVYTCQGNHDSRAWSTYTEWVNNEFSASFNERFYAVDIGAGRFIGIDDSVAEADFPTSWFKQQLSQSSAPWTIVFMNGNYRKKSYLKTILSDHAAQIDVILTAGGGAQYFDADKTLHLESGGADYVYQLVKMTKTSLEATLYASNGSQKRTIVAGQSSPQPQPEVALERPSGLRRLH